MHAGSLVALRVTRPEAEGLGFTDFGRDATTDDRWGIEIECDESPPLDDEDWPDERDDGPLDWLSECEP
jgi:hypothetical protein